LNSSSNPKYNVYLNMVGLWSKWPIQKLSQIL
jgi:hypothetical protein